MPRHIVPRRLPAGSFSPGLRQALPQHRPAGSFSPWLRQAVPRLRPAGSFSPGLRQAVPRHIVPRRWPAGSLSPGLRHAVQRQRPAGSFSPELRQAVPRQIVPRRWPARERRHGQPARWLELAWRAPLRLRLQSPHCHTEVCLNSPVRTERGPDCHRNFAKFQRQTNRSHSLNLKLIPRSCYRLI